MYIRRFDGLSENAWQEALRRGQKALMATQKCAEQATQINLRKAVQDNLSEAKKQGWATYRGRIERLLGYISNKPDTALFARSVAFWQCAHGLKVDGILGGSTWRRMRVAIGVDITRYAFVHVYEDPGKDPREFSVADLFTYIAAGRSSYPSIWADDYRMASAHASSPASGEARQRGIRPARWHGVTLLLRDNQNPRVAVADLQRSFSTEDALVIYYGHSSLKPLKPGIPPIGLGLDPRGEHKYKDLISASELTRMLNKSKAKLFLVGACASKTYIRRLESDIAVVAIDSPQLTDTVVLANAVIDFVDKLVNKGGTVNEAINTGNGVFSGATAIARVPDRFVLVNGNGAIRLIGKQQ